MRYIDADKFKLKLKNVIDYTGLELNEDNSEWGYNSGIEDAINMLDAEPTVYEWFSCKPKVLDTYLANVVRLEDNYESIVMLIYYPDTDAWYWFDDPDGGSLNDEFKVTNWMLLPEAPKKGKVNDNRNN